MKIKRFIRGGNSNLTPKICPDTNDLRDIAAEKLDNLHCWDMIGEILFVGEDGKFYSGFIDFVIKEAHPDYVKYALRAEKET